MNVNRKQDRVAAKFSAAAETYSEAANVQRTASERIIKMLAGLPTPDRILELGCGTGLLTRLLHHRYPSALIHAVDAADKMIEHARREMGKNEGLRWSVADARTLHDDQPYPLVASSSSLHWMTPLEDTFANVSRLLAPDGHFVFAMMLDGSLGELREARLALAPHKPPKGRLPRRPEVLEALEAAGLHTASAQVEAVTITHPDAEDLLNTIRRQGVTGGDVSMGPLPLTSGELRDLVSYYQEHFRAPAGGVRASYHILYAHARRGNG